MTFKTNLSLARDIIKSNFENLPLPFKYFVVITKKCQSRCMHCHIWRESINNELTLDEFRLLAKNSKNNLKWLNLSGGEPLEREDFIQIVETFKQECPDLHIVNFTTNGMYPEKVKEVVQYFETANIPVVGINVSLDGLAQTHNTIRGLNDGFEKALESFKILFESSSAINKSIAFTLFPNNSHEAKPLYEFLKLQFKNFKRHHFHINYPHTSGHYYKNDQLKIPDIQIPEDLRRNFLPLSPINFCEKKYLELLPEYIQTKKTPITCQALHTNIYISEIGDVYPCTLWDKKLGSLRDNQFNLSEILEREYTKNIRKDILNKNCPNCWSPCEAFPSILSNIF